jgi:hypothetical protein
VPAAAGFTGDFAALSQMLQLAAGSLVFPQTSRMLTSAADVLPQPARRCPAIRRTRLGKAG